MAKYRKIDTRIWNDQKFINLTDDAKLIFMFMLTHQHLTSLGAMRASLQGFAGELKWEISRFKIAFDEITKLQVIRFDEKASFLWIPNFLKYNKPESPNVVKSWDQYLDYLPECSLRDELIESVYGCMNSLNPCFAEALPEVFRKTMPNQEQEQEQEQEPEQEKDSARGAQALSKPINFYDHHKTSKHQVEHWEGAKEVLAFLNEKANKKFEPVQANLRNIADRLLQGETIDICRSLIVKKSRSWLGDAKMDAHLNPVTLFKKDNYFRYKGELVLPKDDLVNEHK